MKCTQCGKTIPGKIHYCPYCGRSTGMRKPAPVWLWGLLPLAVILGLVGGSYAVSGRIPFIGAARPGAPTGTMKISMVTETPKPAPAPVILTATATETPASTATLTPTAAPSATPTETLTAPPTETLTKTPTEMPSPSPTSSPTAIPTSSPTTPPAVATAAPAQAAATTARFPRLVLGNYFAWFDDTGWDDCNISAGDKPLQPYNSDDPAVIARHVQMALAAGLDGFSVHWFAPGERTDRNFAAMLAASQSTPFQATTVVSRHIWHGDADTTLDEMVEAIRYIMDNYSRHPNFLKLNGKPVIFFTDMYRVPASSGLQPIPFWAEVRRQTDSNGDYWWIAEGLDANYLEVFDGLYVYKITHADYPNDYAKASTWAARVRQWEKRTGKPKLWIGTMTPGWDDMGANCRPDVRAPAKLHRKERQDGAFYQATFNAAIKSNPDWLWIHSFNEWVEGTYIEPSEQYGDKYMQMTQQFAAQFKK